MSRRRAERQQEKDDFLDTFPELIRVTSRIEVITIEGEDDGPAVAVPDADTELAVQITLDGPESVIGGEDTFILDADDLDAEEVDGALFAETLFLPPLFTIGAVEDFDFGEDDVFGEDEAYLSITERGFGVASGNELLELDDTNEGDFEVAGFVGEDETTGDEIEINETFEVPRGAQPGDVFRIEVEEQEDVFFFGGGFTTTGSAEVQIVGIEIENEPFLF